MENTESRLYFASDYMEGAHPAIMKKLMETNLEKTVGYGQDPYTEDAKEKIRKACNAPEAEVLVAHQRPLQWKSCIAAERILLSESEPVVECRRK